MKNAHPVELLLVTALALGGALWTVARLLLVPAAALLLAALGWRPAPHQPEPVAPAPIASPEVAAPAAEPRPRAPALLLACAPVPVAIAQPPLDRLPVAELRRLARAAGLPSVLSHSGRRAQLLEALAAT